MFYLALARREDAIFLTTDAALKKEAERQGIRTATAV
jgi:predicted nucleic acid-binding protein